MGLFSSRSKKEEVVPIPWIKLEVMSQLDEIINQSSNNPVVIFKHSTRCSISSMALNRFQKDWKENDITPYYLDLLSHRDISNEIANRFNVFHQSPQVLLIKEGKSVYDASHSGIVFSELIEVE